MHGLMPRSRLVVIDGAGHLPPLERPDETTAALRRWLEE
jgi:pimeloyl-ACP methyl ester carboxylesterase